jgi:hypothetical protein
MKKLLIVLNVLLIAFVAHGQGQEAREKIEAAKIALITERLELTPEQAQKFWPIYNELQQKQQSIAQEFRNARENFDPKKATEEENRQMLELGMQLKERKLQMEQEYSQRMLRVISSRQLMNLRKAEDDFRQMLMERVRRRAENRDRANQNRNMQELRNQRRNNN